jgi:hypothetical protein
MSDCGEGEYEYYRLAATKSPKELGTCSSIEALIEMVKESIVEGYKKYEEEDATPVLGDNSAIIQSLQKLSSIDEIKAITIEGYEDTFDGYEDELYAKDEIVTYSMSKKKQVAVSFGADYIESEGTGGFLAFKRKVTKKATPDGYFEEKRKAFFEEDEFDE